MHVHAMQSNPYVALDALRSAQRAAAKREAELVRKELLESASELAGESDLSDACVVKLEDQQEDRQESQRQSRRRYQKQDRSKPQESASSPASSDEGDCHLSDWA
jgi:hypothetical protein